MNINDVSTKWIYPGGEVGVRATNQTDKLTARVQSSEDLMRLMMTLGATKVNSVYIPYLPYARQDRVAVDGDPNAIEVLAKILASSKVQFFSTLDVHSKIAQIKFMEAGCILENKAPDQYIDQYIAHVIGNRRLYLVAPDEGAVQRVKNLHLKAPVEGIIQCGKVRDPNSGQLSGFKLVSGPDNITMATHIMIIDDICDGGGTFHGVANVLKAKYGPYTPVHLWTTHGIYSKGLDDLMRTFVTVGSTNSFIHGQNHRRLFTAEIKES